MTKKNDFIHLKVHSVYSLAEGAIRIPELVKRCKQSKMSAVALADTSNLFGAMDFALTAAKAGIQPICGAQLPVGISKDDPRYQASQTSGMCEPDTLVMIVQNATGYQNLLKLISIAWEQVMHGNVPQVQIETLARYNEGLIILTGSTKGGVARLLAQGQKDAAESLLKQLAEIFPTRVYVELSRLGDPKEIATEQGLVDLAYKYDLPLVATNEAFFIDEDMHEAHDALLCIAEGAYVSQTDRKKVSPNCRLKSPKEMWELFADIPEALENTVVIAKRCSFMVESTQPVLPRYSSERSETEELLNQSMEGLKERLKTKIFTENMDDEAREHIRKQYVARLEYELGIINKMGYPGYFLIVADFIKWAKSQNIPVGPGRGSGAGSLVAWSLTITDINPIQFNLLFERFLNPERVSMPDFDIDFCQERRDEVINYVGEKYGQDHVAQIITFGKLQARMVIRDLGRVLQMPYGQVDRICKLIPNNPANPVSLKDAIKQETELREMVKQEPTVAHLMDLGKQLEGLYRHASTHAAGVVIGDRPLNEIVALYYDQRSSVPATQFNMKDVEKAGLVKFDFLGLRTLTVIARTTEQLHHRGIDIKILDIPLDDEKTFALLNRCECLGVFQLEGGGMVDVIRKLKPSRFEEIIAIGALYRPGPMDDIPRYIACKHGEEKVQYMHPALEDILKETYGVIVYQEQVLQIAQVLAGYTLGEADILRRAMGKKIKSEMYAQRQKFIDGARKHDVTTDVASQIFDQIAKFAGYGFNKSHSAPYALIAYQTAYLKANYPVEFMASLMSLEMTNTDKLNLYRQETSHMNIALLPADINESGVQFLVSTSQENAIHYALAAIKNVGEAAMASIIAEREENGKFKDIWDFANRINSRVLNKRQLENLIAAGAFDALHNNRHQLYASVEQILKQANTSSEARASSQASIFDLIPESSDQQTKLTAMSEWSNLEKLQREFDALGFYLSGHPLDAYTEDLQRLKVLPSTKLQEHFSKPGNETARLAGVVISKKERTAKSGNKYAFVTLADSSGMFEATLFSEKLSSYRDLIEPGQVVYLNTSGSLDDNRLRLTVSTMSLLDESLNQIPSKIAIEIENESALEPLHNILSQKGAAEVLLYIMLPDQTVVINLPDKMAVSGETRTNIMALPGIRAIRDLADD